MSRFKTEIKWALIFVGMQIAWMILEKLSGLHDKHISLHPFITNLVMIPSILIYVFALREKKQNYYQGNITYKQAFTSGLIMTAIITLLAPLVQYITSTWITPDYFKNMIDFTVKSGNSTKEEAEQFFNLKSYLIQTVLFTPVAGLLTTAIVAFFVRNKKM